MMTLQFYAPIYMLLTLCDREQDREEELRKLKLQIRDEAVRLLHTDCPKEAYELLQELRKVEPGNLETEQLILTAHIRMLQQ